MKYIIQRASDLFSGKMPCEGCTYEQVHEIAWDGSVDKDHVERWTKEVDNLLDFVDQYGSIVIEKSDIKEIPYQIMIYDSYIE